MTTIEHQLEQFHGCLNRAGVTPDGCYKRNTAWYSLVSCINHIIALYLSANYDVIPLFLMRVKIVHADIAKTHKHAYLDLVSEYLQLVGLRLREIGFTESQLELYPFGADGDT